MSYSTLYEIYKTKIIDIGEFKNGHGSGPPVWDYLWVNYLNGRHFGWSSAASMQPLWDLAEVSRIPVHLRLCLAFTFDNAYCPMERLPELVEACERTHAAIAEFDPAITNHWGVFADTLRKNRFPKRCLGAGLNCTSLEDSWSEWLCYPPDKRPVLHSIFEMTHL
jgi:hypothetical protein